MRPPTPEEFATSPEWHLQRIDPQSGRWLVVRIDEALLRSASFLDQRIESSVQAGFWFEPEQVPELTSLCEASPGRPATIFHLGHCGSTLLSRGLASDSAVLPLREPLTLRYLADMLRGGPDMEEWKSKTKSILAALGRSFSPQQMPLVKASSTCNNLAASLLAADPERRSLGIYVSLTAQLGNMLGRQNPMTDLKGFAAQRLTDWRAISENGPEGFDPASDLHLSVLSWLTGMHQLLDAKESHPQQLQLVNFDEFLGSPADTLPALNAFLRLGADDAAILAGWPGVAGSYSKQPDAPFDASARSARLQRAREQHADSLLQGLNWAESLISRHPKLQRCKAHID